MATMNINSSVMDTFYRYKMPRLLAKREGKGNGIKTVLVNIEEISKALNRPPTYPTKFFGCELGAQTQMDARKSRYIVNGSHDAKDLQELLDKFIKKYVLCPQCENPETDMRVSSQGRIKARCVACGWRGEMDNNHRVAAFIVRNPPANEHSISKADKKERKREKKEDVNGEGKDGGKVRRSKSEKGKTETSSQRERKKADATQQAGSDDDDWSMDVSEAAVRARREALEDDLGESVKGMTLTEADYMDMSEKERLEAFRAFCMKTNDEKEVFDEAVRLGIQDKAMAVITDLKFDEKVLLQIKQNCLLLQKFCAGAKETQRGLLGALERLVSVVYPFLLPKTAHIIKALYDLDIVDEETLLEWGDQSSSQYVSSSNFKLVLAKASPVLEWLREAESEEDEDGVQFTETNGAVPPATDVPQTAAAGKVSEGTDDSDDDLDIDNI